MNLTRRDLLQRGLALAAIAATGRLAHADAAAPPISPARKSLDILVLGGTGFIGPKQIEYALARGHRVTMFNRGRTAAGMYGDRVETLIGDRDTRVGDGLEALQGTRRWDAVIDNSGYVPRHVRDSAQLLHGRVGRYLYISSTASYAPSGTAPLDEHSPLIQLADLSDERRTSTSYGPMKAAGDQIVRTIYGKAATAVRPTFIVGPGDTGGFTYWVDRVSAGGNVLGPSDPGKEMRWVDVRDLCPWVVTLLENDVSGAFNASAPTSVVTWEAGLHTMATAVKAPPLNLHSLKPEVARDLGINLPLAMFAGADGHIVADASRRAGLNYRPLAETTRGVLEWWKGQPASMRKAAAARWPSRELEARAIARG